MTTDTPKRLSDAELIKELREIASDGCAYEPARRKTITMAADTLEHLSTPPSQDKVERARELFIAKLRENGHDWLMVDEPTRSSAIAAITQALSEGSGQGGAEGLRTAALAVLDWYNKDGSVGGAVWPMENLGRALKTLPSIEKEVEPSEAQVEPTCDWPDRGLARCTRRPIADSDYFVCQTIGCPRMPKASALKAALSHNQTGKEKGE